MSAIRGLDVLKTPESLTGAKCRRLRTRFDLHVLLVASRAGVDAHTLQQWEANRWRKSTGAWRAAVCRAVQELIVETCIATAVTWGNPADPRLSHLRLRKIQQGRRPNGAFAPAPRVELVA